MRVFRHLTAKKIFSIAFFVIVLSFCVYFFSVRFFEKTAYDFMVKLAANKTGSEKIVNVVIDESSIKEIGDWPWKRTLYADMFEYLQNSGASFIAFDAVLTDKVDPANDAEFLARIKNIKNISAGVNFSKNENVSNNESEYAYFSEKFPIKVTDKRKSSYIKKTSYNAYQEMIPDYINSLNQIGAVNTALDIDGKVRAFEPFVLMNGKYYPSLPLSVYIKMNNIKELVIYDDAYDAIAQNGATYRFPMVLTSEKPVQYIKWLAPFNKDSWVPHEQIKASDIIKSYENVKNGEAPVVDSAKVKDKIVVIGATANALYDLKITPMTINMPGSSIQATAIDNLLSADSISIATTFTNVLCMLFFMIIIFLLILYLTPLISIIGVLLLVFLYFYVALFAYSHGVAINVITPYIFFILMTIFSYSYKFTIEDYKKEKLKRAMRKYISTTVVDDIIKNSDEEIKLGGKKSEITILMADIRGFTRLSENLEPDVVTLLLNEYFGLMIPIIEKFGGSVNKFIGDAILVVFNEPVKDKRHPYNAVCCATEMLAALRELRKKWKSEGKPDIGISIGINTGNAFIGNIGTPNHMEYTVIGDTVNVASRIEAQNRQFNTQILISESTYECVKDSVDVIKISSVEIRGREQHMNIYEVIKILDTNETN